MNYQNMIDKLDNPSGSFGQFIRKLGEDHARKNDYLAPAASMSIHTGDTSTAVEPCQLNPDYGRQRRRSDAGFHNERALL